MRLSTTTPQRVQLSLCSRATSRATGREDYPTIALLAEERLRRSAKKVKGENPMFAGDLGFRVFKLDYSNIRAWEPDRNDLPKTLEESVEHLRPTALSRTSSTNCCSSLASICVCH